MELLFLCTDELYCRQFCADCVLSEDAIDLCPRQKQCCWAVKADVEIRKTYVSLHGECISRRLDIFSQYFQNLVTMNSLEFPK